MNNTLIQPFENVTELLQACEKAYNEGRRSKSYQPYYFTKARDEFIKYCDENGNNLTINRSWKDTMNAVYQPWQYGLDACQFMIYELEKEGLSLPVPKTRKRKPKYNPDDGDEIDLDRLRGGQDYWRKCVREQTRGPQFVTLITSSTAPCYMNAIDIMWRGVVGIVLCDLLEKHDFRVRFVNTFYTDHKYDSGPHAGYGNKELTYVVIKQEQDPVDISSFINLTSGWFLRTVMFESCHIRGWNVNDGYGGVEKITPGLECIQNLVGAGSIPVIVDGVWSKTEALALIKKTIETLNLEGA